MFADLKGFDAAQVEPSTAFDPLPAGNYEVVLTASELKQTRNKDGQYLQLEFEVIEGEYKGRRLWDRLTLNHHNDTAVKIARAKLSSLCRATGVLQPKDSGELHNIPIAVKVKLKRRTDTDELVNQLVSFQPKASLEGKPIQAQSDAAPWSRN